MTPAAVARIDAVAESFAETLSRRKHGVGETLAGKYRIVRELGDGGMGQVFVAENLAIGCQVAIKLLKPELLADEAFRKRFQKEAEAVAAVVHQNVVRFLDLVVGDPTFLVMEYVDGPTLAELLKRDTRLVPSRAAKLTARLCWGLEAAHRAGVVHRDVKPSNIILAPDTELGEQPKLIDFGVAKTASKPADVQLTRHGQMVGTPHYMSPEQVSGADVDARSDIYALGCVLYHMVAGRPPFLGSEEWQILQGHMEKTATPLSHLVADVPPEIDKVVQRALAKDPLMRYSSMQEMARALAAVADQQAAVVPETPTVASSPSRSRTTKAARAERRVPLAVAAAVVLVAIAAGVGGAYFFARHGRGGDTMLLVSSDPAGAAVVVDGKPQRDTTPTAIATGAGEHVVKLSLDGHNEVERHVTLAAGKRELVSVAMPALSHRVSVTTAPDGASVFLDGNVVLGTTPTFMTVTDDDFHEVRIERDGYQTLTYSLKPEDRQAALSFALEPEKEARGTVSVDSNGAAQVFVDGVYSGFDTPTLPMHLTVGEHTIEARGSAGLASAPAKVVVKKGESLHLTLSLVGGK